MANSSAGKGDKPRPVDRKKWDAAWARYEKAKKKMVENKKLLIWLCEDDPNLHHHYKLEFEKDKNLPSHTLRLFNSPGQATHAGGSPDIIFMDIAAMPSDVGTWAVALADSRKLMELHPGAVLILYSAVREYAKEVVEEIRKDAEKAGVVLDFIAGFDAYLLKDKVILYGD